VFSKVFLAVLGSCIIGYLCLKMKKKPVVTAIFCLLALSLIGQTVQHSLTQARCFRYKHWFYVYGYEQRREELSFRCFSYDAQLNLKDSATFDLGKCNANQFLDINHDTVHDVLSFYFQKADQKNLATLCRLDSNLRLIASAQRLDASHINSLTSFGEDHYRDRNSLYTITSAKSDTNNEKQFYLSKYSLKAVDKPFEYDFKWQFPFDRQYIHRASILFSDASMVLVHVHVSDGAKQGQWLLWIDARKGNLLKARKINPKGDTRHFLCGTVLINPRDKSICIAGSIIPENTIDFKKNLADFNGLAKTHSLFLISLDSLGDITMRAERVLPLPTGKDHGTLHLKLRSLAKTGGNSFTLWGDLYEEQAAGNMQYFSSWLLSLAVDEQILNIKSSAVYPIRKLIPDLINPASGRTFTSYGKLLLKTPSDYDRFLLAPAKTDVVSSYRTDAKGQPALLLKKMNGNGTQTTWQKVYTNDKGLVVAPVLLTVKGEYTALFPSEKRYILFKSNSVLNQYELNTGEW